MSEWLEPGNLKRMIDHASYHKDNIYLTHEQFQSVLDEFQSERDPYDFDWMPSSRVMTTLVGTPVIVVDSVTDSTPFKMGLLP